MAKTVRDQFLEDEFKRLAEALDEVYKGTQRAAQKHLSKYLKEYKGLEESLDRAVKNGNMSESEKHEEIRKQVFKGKVWNDEREDLSEMMYEADDEAAEYANSRKDEIYVQSRNMTRYDTDMNYKRLMGLGIFTYEMMKEKPKPTKVNKVKDVIWNRKKIQTEVVKNVYRAKTLYSVGTRAVNGFVSSARNGTYINMQRYLWGISDQAEWEEMLNLKASGIDVQKQWIATLDSHTRMTHRELDKEIEEVEEPFWVGGSEIMFPRDPNAPIALTANCRCRLKKIYPKYADLDTDHMRTENILGFDRQRRRIPDMSYHEWLDFLEDEEEEDEE